MGETKFALVKGLDKLSEFPHRTDIIKGEDEWFYQIFQVASKDEWFKVDFLSGFFVMRVQRIMEAKSGDIQWKIPH